ncbi:MAG TPA: serine/threonine-protein kinase [Polyangiaceae bacterium]|jgi:serine/threonine-protein kinase|nr:serine/threonine-protein kinase [Polyangiaceae bacterium]
MPGKRCGRYQLLELLGRGGMADVYAACRADGDAPQPRFALKLLQRKWSLDPQLRAMFESEARLTTALNHPNLVRVYDTGEHLGVPFMVMEFVDGVTVARLLRSVASRSERFPAAPALVICAEVLAGLIHAHGATDEVGSPLGIVHRDVSPGNILISRSGRVKLADFGIARSTQIDHHTDPGQVKGKFGYMSPEQVMGDEQLDARSDLFSLGVVLAEMLIGRRLFSGKGEFEVLTRMYEADIAVLEEESCHVEPALVALLKKALQRDRSQRFQTAGEFLSALASVANELGIALDDGSLVPWLFQLGAMPSQSGTYSLQIDPARTDRRNSPFKR